MSYFAWGFKFAVCGKHGIPREESAIKAGIQGAPGVWKNDTPNFRRVIFSTCRHKDTSENSGSLK